MATHITAIFLALVLFGGRDARERLIETANAHGGREHFYSMRDAQMDITVCNKKNICETSIQRYLFDGEKLEGTDAKRNYFLFAMPFKLLDKGAKAEQLNYRGDSSDLVEVRYDHGDRFRIYIDRHTKRIERFLFTDLSSHRTEPHLMICRHREVSGIWLLAEREEYPANWDGNILGPRIRQERIEKIQFWNGFSF